MIRLRVLCVGRSDAGFIREGVEHYLKRLRPVLPVAWEEVRAAGHSGRSVEQALAAEGQAILKKIGAGDRLVLLDERGKSLTSPGLAQWLARVRRLPGSSAVLLVGGAYGVSEEVKQRADETLSLSPMTLPHQLVRVVLLEQLYRAATILAGQPYHHG
jgi:23S rRNA (pseudouridine1915-N3)-methyltransferase